MKKVYMKPQIMFESFALSTSIAGDCGIRTNTPSDGNCGYEMTDEFGDVSTLFLDSMTGVCSTYQPDGYNGICYDVPTDTGNLFNS